MGFERPEQAETEQPLNLQPRRTATNFSVRPVPVRWGLHRSGGTFIDGIFGYETEAIMERVQTGKSSSEEITTAINYFGGIALNVGFGPMHRLLSILKDDISVWAGDVTTDADPYYTINIEGENVPMVIYTGRQDLGTSRGGGITDSSLPSGHPTYRGQIYFLFDRLLFGTAPNPPNFEIIYEVIHRALILDPANTTGDPEQDDIELHRVDQGQLIPEIIYSALTNPLFGGNMTEDDFDLPSWIDACNVMRSEGLGYSPELTTKTVTESWVKDLLNFAHAEINTVNGRLVFTLKRSIDTVTTIPETAFLKDPTVKPGSWNDRAIVNEVRIPYALLSRELEPLNTVQSDDSSRGIVGLRTKSYSFAGLRSEIAAAQLATRFVNALGFPPVSYSMELDRSMKGILKGSLIAPVYPDRGLDGTTILRVSDVTRSAPGKGGITLMAAVDKSYIANSSSGESDAEVSFETPIPQPITGHICAIPDQQKDTFDDGMIIAMSRTSASDDRALVSFGWDGISYDAITATGAFPLRLDVIRWRDFGDGFFTLDFSFSQPHEEAALLAAITDSLPDWHLLTVDSGGNLQRASWSVLRAGSTLQAVGGGVYALSFKSAQFGTQQIEKDRNSPSTVCYLGPVGGFMFYRSNQRRIFTETENAPQDEDRVRRLAIQSSTRGNSQDFADAYRIDYDRPADTLTPSWGGEADHAFDYGISVVNDSGAAPLALSIWITGTESFDYTSDWGDGGAIETGTGNPNDMLVHSYVAAGSYVSTLTITPSAGGVSQIFTTPVTVT